MIICSYETNVRGRRGEGCKCPLLSAGTAGCLRRQCGSSAGVGALAVFGQTEHGKLLQVHGQASSCQSFFACPSNLLLNAKSFILPFH